MTVLNALRKHENIIIATVFININLYSLVVCASFIEVL